MSRKFKKFLVELKETKNISILDYDYEGKGNVTKIYDIILNQLTKDKDIIDNILKTTLTKISSGLNIFNYKRTIKNITSDPEKQKKLLFFYIVIYDSLIKNPDSFFANLKIKWKDINIDINEIKDKFEKSIEDYDYKQYDTIYETYIKNSEDLNKKLSKLLQK